MKASKNSRLALSLFLLGAVGTGAARAGEPIGDPQAQAMLLLSGQGFPAGSRKPHAAASNRGDSSLPAADVQEQARQMILGGSTTRRDVDGLRAVNSARIHHVGGDAQELARRMILGTPASSTKRG